jgi:carbon-monoxide dehydrogenase medium subunit
MIRTPMRYHRPESPADVSAILAEHGDGAAVLGGGTWLLPLMNRGERTHDHVIDLKGLGAAPIARVGEGFELAATATYEDVLADAGLCAAVPALARMTAGVTGGRQLRNQATLVGSACFQNPSSEVPAAFAALGAVLHLHGPGGVRDVPAAEFFEDAFATSLRDGEFVTGAFIPARGLRAGYVKVKIADGGWPVATAVALRDATTGETTVTVGAVEPCPLKIDITDLWEGGGVRRDALGARVAEKITNPWSDVLAAGDYRREIAAVVAGRAVEQIGGEEH